MATLGAAYLRYTRFVFVLGAMLYSISNAYETCNSPWKMIYENDFQGQPVKGNLSDLFEAHARGARIKYMIPSLGEAGIVENVDSSVVYMGLFCGESVTHIIKDTWDHFLDDGQWRVIVACSFGLYTTVNKTIGSSDAAIKSDLYVGILWFVQESTCPTSVYFHSDDGGAIKDSKDELRNAVVSGFDIRYYLGNYYMFPCHNIDISESSEVVGQTIWLFDTGITEWWFQMFSTNGIEDIILWDMGEHVSYSHKNRHYQGEWFVEPCWRHVFTNDDNGVELEGSLAALVAAVEHGNRVKVVMGTYSIEVNNLRTELGQVSAQSLAQVSKESSYYFLNDTFWIWQMVHTTGVVRTRRYSIGDVINRGDTVEMKMISWFVDTRPWTKVFSTNHYGVASFGSKAALKNAVENGATVRVGLQFGQNGVHSDEDASGWFVMKADDLEISSSGEVAAALIKSVSTEAFCQGEYRIKDNPSWRFMLVTTLSNVDISQWRVGAHIDDGHFTEKANVNWFVNY